MQHVATAVRHGRGMEDDQADHRPINPVQRFMSAGGWRFWVPVLIALAVLVLLAVVFGDPKYIPPPN